jgi:hypothetical protein
MLLVHEDAHELHDGERWVRVVQLQAHVVRQLLQRVATGGVAPKNVLDRGRYEEVSDADVLANAIGRWRCGGLERMGRGCEGGGGATHCCFRRSSLPL